MRRRSIVLACVALAACERRPSGSAPAPGEASPGAASTPAATTPTSTASSPSPEGPPTAPISKQGPARVVCAELAHGDAAVRATCLREAERRPAVLRACVDCRAEDAGACAAECQPLLTPGPSK